MQSVSEWPGSVPQKFTTWKAHVPEPTPSDSTYHPLFNVNQRQHFPEQRSQEFKWVSSSKPVPQVVRTERPEGKQFKPLKFTEDKTHFEKKHNLESCKETTKTWDNPKLTKVTFAHHNKATLKETGLEQIMTQKHRVVTIDQQRGGYPMNSLGDKIYKAVEYESGFFKSGGLIVGSTNTLKQKSATGKTVDFYSGLKLDGPLNPGSKNYETVTREQEHRNEVTDVSGLRNWERQILSEVDTKYDPDDDSSDEEAIAARKARAAAKIAREQAEAEAKALADPKNKKK